MTADAGELKTRVPGSKDEVENFGDLKCGNELKNNNACCEGEEIGGSFVIVNGDSDDGTDRDLGKNETENGNWKLKNESSHENGKLLEEKSEDWNLVHGRSNGDCIENEKEKEGGDVKLTENKEVVEVDNGKVAEGNKVIMHEEEREVLDVAKEKQDGQTLTESDPKVELESEVREVKMPIAVIPESVSVAEPETLIPEEHASGDLTVAVESEVKQDLTAAEEQEVEERSDLVNVAQKTDEVETEINQDLILAVEETEDLAEVKDVKVESKQDIGFEKEANESVDLGNLVEGNDCDVEEVIASEPEPDVVVDEEQNTIDADKDVEVERKLDSGSSVSVVLVNENCTQVEQMSIVEFEPEMDHDTVVEETKNVEVKLQHENDSISEEANHIDVEVDHISDPADKNNKLEAKLSPEFDSIDEDNQNVNADLSHESHRIAGETNNSELVLEHKSDPAIEVIKNILVKVDHESDPAVEEAKNVEVEQDSDPIVEEVKNVEVNLEQESDPIVEETENAKVDLEQEFDPIVEETENAKLELEQESDPIAEETENAKLELEQEPVPIAEGAQHSEVELEQEPVPIAEEAKEVEVQVSDPIAEAKDASDPIVQKVEKSELDASAREYVPLNLILVNTENERVDTHVKDVVNHGNAIDPIPKVHGNPLDSKSKSWASASEKDMARNEINTGIAVDEIRIESESGIEGSKCTITSIKDDKPTNKYHEEEKSGKQAQFAESVQAPFETHVARKQYIYMIKVPRVIDDELQKQIQHASSLVVEKTNLRNSIGEETREQAAVVNNYSLDYKAELAKEKAARAVFNAKRKEIDNVQVLLSRLNNANSISDIDEKIKNMVHKQQHETISLKQEKQYIHDITQMKRLKEQLSLKHPAQEQIDEVINQKDEIESRLKNLKKELDSLRVSLSSRESSIKSAWNKYMEQEQILKTLREKHIAADRDRQEAYLNWRKLKFQYSDKMKHFQMYKADHNAAANYIFSRDTQSLQSHCARQVEKVMDLWNKSPDFRKQYVKSNMNSTLRRLGTADGRQLGPGEVAPTTVRAPFYKNSNHLSTPSSSRQPSAPALKAEVVTKEQSIEPSKSSQEAKSTQEAKSKQEPKPKQESKSKQAAKVKPSVSISEELKEKEKTEKENKLKKEEEEKLREEEEMMRKKAAEEEEERMREQAAEEEKLRKEKEAIELKEKLRSEQIAKAKEAEERKKRKAEKAKERAEIKAKKEAELREKKKAKKEKKSGISDTGSEAAEEGPTPAEKTQSESSQDHDFSSSSAAAATKKRSTKPAGKSKAYNKVQPIPPPLRNKNRRKLASYLWAAFIALCVLAIFFAGFYISFPSFNLSPNFDI